MGILQSHMSLLDAVILFYLFISGCVFYASLLCSLTPFFTLFSPFFPPFYLPSLNSAFHYIYRLNCSLHLKTVRSQKLNA